MLFLYIFNNLTHKILVQNTLYQTIFLPHCQRLGILTKVLYKNYFQVVLDLKLAKYLSIAPCHQVGIKVLALKPAFETYLANEIRVYEELLAVQKIANLVNIILSI